MSTPVKPPIDTLANLHALRSAAAALPEEALYLDKWCSKSQYPACGSIYCIGGLATTMPFFRAQGLTAGLHGAPVLASAPRAHNSMDSVLNLLFEPFPGAIACDLDYIGPLAPTDFPVTDTAFRYIFMTYGDGVWDQQIMDAFEAEFDRTNDDPSTEFCQYSISHKELALARLDMAIARWEESHDLT